MAYFPTWKGGLRMERLRHYFHEDMACLLEMDPDVLRWSTDGLASDGLDESANASARASIVAETTTGWRFIRLYDDTGPGKAKSPRLSRRRDTDGSDNLESLSRTELKSHPRLAASEEFLFHRPRRWEPELPLRVATMNAVHPVGSLGELHGRLNSNAVRWEDVLSLVAQGFVTVDMDDPVGPAIKVVSCKAVGHLG